MGRFIVGVGVAVSAVADVSYLAEVSPRNIRGAMVSANELAIASGMMVAFVVGHVLRHTVGKTRNTTVARPQPGVSHSNSPAVQSRSSDISNPRHPVLPCATCRGIYIVPHAVFLSEGAMFKCSNGKGIQTIIVAFERQTQVMDATQVRAE